MKQIRHEGIITAIADEKITVEISAKDACRTCCLKGACGQTAEIKRFSLESTDNSAYKVGQKVEIVITPQQLMTAALWGYILPLILILTVLFAVYETTDDETQAAICALTALPIYYAALFCFRHRLKKMLQIRISAKNIFP